jgi:cytoplasmic iron level regulating protein YaaA (DUF328/UPF0246 family)
MRQLRGKSADELCELMHISSKLGELNHQRNKSWKAPFTPENARPAIFAFKGDVYLGLKVEQFNAGDLEFAQAHLRILSGLYGILRPLDLMQPYRLEMGTRLVTPRGKNLYQFWGIQVSQYLNKRARGLMVRHAVLNRVTTPEQLKAFNAEGYRYVPAASDADRLVFRRDQKA